MATAADTTTAKFERTLVKCFQHSGGAAWEPRDPTGPFFTWAIEGGFLRRVDGRCGFEVTKDSMVTWTAAGKAAMTARAALQRVADTPKEGEPCPEAPRFLQSWTDEGGRYAIDVLHDLIDSARKLALVPPPAAAAASASNSN